MILNLSEIINEFIENPNKKHNFLEISNRISSECKKIPQDIQTGEWIEIDLGVIGKIPFPYLVFSNNTSINLFTAYDLLLFANYYRLKDEFRYFIDIGANIGLHSAVALKCGYVTKAFEPDPITFRHAGNFLEKINSSLEIKRKENLRDTQNWNKSQLIEAAVLPGSDEVEFVRFNSNPFGNHVKGMKSDIYGETEIFKVKCIDLDDCLIGSSIIKIDGEGSDLLILEKIANQESRGSGPHDLAYVYLCDWRLETREAIGRMIIDKNLTAFIRDTDERVEKIDQLPNLRSDDFVKVVMNLPQKCK